ncbi:lamin tail domain-containing protein [Halegenticoccus soli]|uniref:lamin tail domain-containing protein n=1 Tax=Halegenticoccus soli TaxID=1985678 RepID=UPI001E3E8257|nr:lamin tail domain-containing protein [Halegenticoccus soli]
MNFAERIPGMKPGATGRNAAVAIGYLLLFPFALAWAIGTNRYGLADRLARAPGISRGGGLKTGVVAFAYVAVALAVLAAGLPSDGTGAETPASDAPETGTAEASDRNAAGTSTLSSTGTPSSSSAPASDRSVSDQSASDSSASGTPAADRSETSSSSEGPPSPNDASSPQSTAASTETRGPSAGASGSETESAPPTEETQTAADSDASSDEAPPSSGADARRATVVEVVDGDTLKLRFADGTRETARLLGVDTPETYGENDPEEFEGVPNTDAGERCLRERGEAATAFARERLLGEEATISYDENEGKRGYYGRLLVYVEHDGRSFNYRLVDEGYARVYDSQFEERDRFYAAEAKAQERGAGVWECRDVGTPTPTPAPTSTPIPDGGSAGELTVSEIREDAPGNDHDNLNGEYVVFENTGDSTLALSGWSVSDEADHTYRFPQGFTLEPGAEVTLYTGSGTDSATELYWGSGSAVWNNGGDTIYVRDDSGDLVAKEAY